jgi:arginine exporter protein ArgO
MEYLLFLGFIFSIGIGFGIISSTPLGPINLLVAENYLSVKKVQIVPFLSGVILIDSIFGYLTFWGFDKFLSDYELVGAGIGIFGGLAIIALGGIGIYQQMKGKHNSDKKNRN